MYVCDQCGQESSQWVGKCPSCGAWNTFKEIHIAPPVKGNPRSVPVSGTLRGEEPKFRPLLSIQAALQQRIDTGDEEFNRVLGGGIVPGSLVLLGGEPGIGKSTLLLQTVLRLPDLRVLYVSGEESESQLKLRADRLMGNAQEGQNCFVLCETSLEKIYEQAQQLQPQLIIVDSVQAISSEQGDAFPGSPSQVRACAVGLLRFAKESGIPVFLVGHITKDGSLAGPKILEHIVDAVLQFEGDRQHFYRVLRGLKNRFGSTDELGIYEMQGSGLRPVSNPSEMLLNRENEGMSGVAVASAIEGARPLLIETQALVSSAVYGTPQRSATGFDLRRLNMLLAVLEKRVGFKLAQKDVFLNIAGGLRVSDTAIDLSVIVAVLSSNVDTPILGATCLAGEVGLSGEIRPVTHIQQRVAEAERQGFRRMIVPRQNARSLQTDRLSIEIIPVSKVEDALRHLFN